MHEDAPPQPVEGSVIFFAYAAIIAAAIMSLTLNISHDTHSTKLASGIAIMIGVGIPLLVVFISHVAATIPMNWWVKSWLFALTGALMYVSATAGTKVLAPALGLWPALAVSIGADATAMTFLGVLMHARERKTAIAVWHAAAAERDRQARLGVTAARHARPQPGNTAGSNGGNAAGNISGNSLGDTAGNTAGAPAGNTAPALRGPGGALAITAGTASAGVPAGEGAGAALRLVGGDDQRPGPVSEEEMYDLARALAKELAAVGRQLTFRAYKDRYRGRSETIAKVVAAVKAELDDRVPAEAEAR
jgi:hypothetical protein